MRRLALVPLAVFLTVPALAQTDAERRARELAEERRKRDETVWAAEVVAQQHEMPFVRLWDGLLASDDDLAGLAAFRFETLAHGRTIETRALEDGIEERRWGEPDTTLTHDEYRDLLGRLGEEGYRVLETEWHHAEFVPASGDQPARSVVSALLHVLTPAGGRLAVRGKLHVEWSGTTDREGLPVPRRIEARDVVLHERAGEPVFVEAAGTSIPESMRQERPTPLLVHDLDGNGSSDLVLAGLNRVWWNERGRFSMGRLLDQAVPLRDAAVLADVDGDGATDLVAVGGDGSLLLFAGTPEGRFPGQARVCAPAEVRFDAPKVMTAGDADGDGDLDLFVAQYLNPYVQGQMPTPFFDANDGLPARYLVNDGKGNFHDATKAAGLAAKRFRRTYSTSFVDLDGDVDLDLVVVSDFSGIDVYTNDGKGSFTDVTGTSVDHRHSFGMAHAFADFDLDERLDVYVLGMGSTTARRLEALGLGPAERDEITRMRMPMGYGNRMYLARGSATEPRFEMPAWRDQVARSGWSWGTTAIDFDNDGDRDVYVANGHTSGRSTQDYCTTYWRHDIYQGDSKPDLAHLRVFSDSLRGIREGEISWNGYEHNVLFLNQGGRSFTNVAWPLGVAFEYDSRSVVGDDLDGDGRPDLVVLEVKWRGTEANWQLHAYLNRLPTSNHWIGVRLSPTAGGVPIFGARVVVEAGGARQPAAVVAGDSYSAQHAPAVHFGLGSAPEVEALEIRWPDGSVTRLDRPGIDRWHDVAAPAPR